jgi:hypothetical protein
MLKKSSSFVNEEVVIMSAYILILRDVFLPLAIGFLIGKYIIKIVLGTIIGFTFGEIVVKLAELNDNLICRLRRMIISGLVWFKEQMGEFAFTFLVIGSILYLLVAVVKFLHKNGMIVMSRSPRIY